MTSANLYQWPAAATFGRVIPKSKFYEHGHVSAAVRERFVAEIERITWAYKLADDTLHLSGTVAVPEIQVFVINAKRDDVEDRVLQAIDKAVHFPIIFEVNRTSGSDAETRMCAAHKRLTIRQAQVGTYFTTEWLPAGAERTWLPQALDLPSLYEALMSPLLPLPARRGECLADAVARADGAQKLEREIGSLERRMRNERQFNRKVELRRQLLARTQALSALTGREQSSPGPGTG